MGAASKNAGKVEEVADYFCLNEEQENVSLLHLPLHYRGEFIGGLARVKKLRLVGKGAHGDIVQWLVTTWTIGFYKNGDFVLKVKSHSDFESTWTKLLQPHKMYQETATTALLVASFLNSARRQPQCNESYMLKHLHSTLKMGSKQRRTIYESLRSHLSVILGFARLDPKLTNANVIRTFQSKLSASGAIKRKPGEGDLQHRRETRHVPGEEKRQRIELQRTPDWTDSLTESGEIGSEDSSALEECKDEGIEGELPEPGLSELNSEKENGVGAEEKNFELESGGEEEYDGEEMGENSSWCHICDDGGNLLFCDGPCMRSFHAYKEAGINSVCRSLGLSKLEVEQMDKWFCQNCRFKLHQCFICGNLGSSDVNLGRQREVFVCDVALCGRFYHPTCVAKRLVPPKEQGSLAARIRQGALTFFCPAHKCQECGQGEDKEDEDLRLGKCRRCPTAWHKKCIPSELHFDDDDGPQRAWMLGSKNRIIVYCKNHEIDLQLLTPKRDHYIFPRNPAPLTAAGRRLESAKTPAQLVLRKPESNLQILATRCDHSTSSLQVTAGRNVQLTPKLQPFALSRIQNIIIRSQEQVKIENVRKNLAQPTRYKEIVDRNFIHDGELHSILTAVSKALEYLQEPDGREDSEMICPKQSLKRLIRQEELLGHFLSPTLTGHRYTTFGRHFTKANKLQEIVGKLQHYIKDLDMVVDFCCGANDFSQLMHDALLMAGKRKCQFKNYDIHPPANNFNFEKKDMFLVKKAELPPGERLVMGLNPPFCVSNLFVRHILTFEPKLVVLIVPRETETLSNKGYTLIWQDDQLLKGKSFYLPGSLNNQDDQCESWNRNTPPLYLWCRNDWVHQYQWQAYNLGHAEKPVVDSIPYPPPVPRPMQTLENLSEPIWPPQNLLEPTWAPENLPKPMWPPLDAHEPMWNSENFHEPMRPPLDAHEPMWNSQNFHEPMWPPQNAYQPWPQTLPCHAPGPFIHRPQRPNYLEHEPTAAYMQLQDRRFPPPFQL